MSGSQNEKTDIVFRLYLDPRTVFRLNDIAMIAGESNLRWLSRKMNYYVRTGKLNNPRKGIYTKTGYKAEELGCSLYAPSYISLEYVLQRSGVIFQYSSQITLVSYLSRELTIENQQFRYRKIKGEIVANTAGIQQLPNHINMATPERAFLDILYLSPDFYFDNLNPLNFEAVKRLLRVYSSVSLSKKATKLLKND
jgi:hypothetical protein